MIFYRKTIVLLSFIIGTKDYNSQSIEMFAQLCTDTTIQIKILNNSLRNYIFPIDTTYIGIYEEEGKLWYEITDTSDKPILKYNSSSGFRVFPSSEYGQKWKRKSEIKDSTNRSIAKFLIKSKEFKLYKKSAMQLNFKFEPDIYERLPEEERDHVTKYRLIRGERYKVRVIYTPDIELGNKNKQVYTKKVFSNYFFFEY